MPPSAAIRPNRKVTARFDLVSGLVLCLGMSVGLPGQGYSQPVLSPVDKLVIENDINQQITLYGLLADGDGISHKDVRTLADKTLATDVVTDIILPNGKTISHTTSSKEVVASTPTPVERSVGGRHFLVSTYFDEVTATTAKTRTTTLYLEAVKDIGPGCEKAGPDECGGRVTHAVTLVYHDTWNKMADGWRKTKSALYRDN